MYSIIKYFIYLSGYLLHHNRESKVIYYHDVGNNYTSMGTPFIVLQSHIDTIRKRGFHIVDKITDRYNQIQICFDDGWAGIYEYKDFFVSENINPTIFIANNLIDQKGYLTISQIKELALLGFLFEGHTLSHNDLTIFNEATLFEELHGSKIMLEEKCGIHIHDICFPRGRFSKEICLVAKNSGYDKLYSSITGSYYDYVDNQIICRNLVQSLTKNQVLFVIEGKSYIMRRRNINQHFEGTWK